MASFLDITGGLALVFGVISMWVGLTATDVHILLGALTAVGGIGLIGMGAILKRLPIPRNEQAAQQLEPHPDNH